MEENSKNIDIENEQNKIRSKIDNIQQSGIFNQLNASLNHFKDNSLDPLQEKNIHIYGRLKKASSAIAKIAQKKISSDEIYDLIAFMFVVDLPEDYNNIQELLLSKLPGLTYQRLFIGTEPDCNGYSSLHFGINVDTFLSAQGLNSTTELDGLSAEIQLKTYGMYMAQETTHDSIYKNDNLSHTQKLEMQSLIFPLIEHLTDIKMYERKLNATVNEEERKSIEEKISDLKQAIIAHKEHNKDYISENISLVDSVFKEYVARKSIEKLKNSISSELSSEQTEGLIATYREAINYLSDSQQPEILSDTEPTGLKNIDELLEMFENMEFNDVINLSQKYKAQGKYTTLKSVMNLSKNSVTLNDMRTALNDLQSDISQESVKNEIEQNK